MYLAEYLLSIKEFLTEESGEALVERAFSCVDEERKRKAERIRPGRARAASLGAGLLLQLAAGEALRGGGAGGTTRGNVMYSVSRLLDCLEELPRQSFSYHYGKNGKPYFRDLPFYFSLSHSGDYVFCALSTEEIGADIQQHRKRPGRDQRRHLADRFFSEEEKRALEASGESAALFYRLWARKEALGKLTGKGVAGILKVNLLPEDGGQSEASMGYAGGTRPEEGISPEGRVPGAAALSKDGVPSGNEMVSGSGSEAAQEKEEPARERILLPGRRLVWKEYGHIPGYSIAVCHVTA